MQPIHLILAALILLSTAFAQDVPPPPKPKDDGPSLEVTMKFIEEKLNSIGRVNYMAYLHNNTDGSDMTLRISDEAKNLRAAAATCRIDFHDWEMQNEKVKADSDVWFLLKAVQEVAVKTREQDAKEIDSKSGHPEFSYRVDPPIFILSINRKNGNHTISFYDEAMANRVAKALVHAVELCGGGNKDPF
jgi:hypothetical protein